MQIVIILASALMGCSSLEHEAEETCFASCARQRTFCESIDEQGCQGLCVWVVATIADQPECLDLGIAQWECNLDQEWMCSDETDIVGEPVDGTLCAEEDSDYKDADCGA